MLGRGDLISTSQEKKQPQGLREKQIEKVEQTVCAWMDEKRGISHAGKKEKCK